VGAASLAGSFSYSTPPIIPIAGHYLSFLQFLSCVLDMEMHGNALFKHVSEKERETLSLSLSISVWRVGRKTARA